MSTKQERLLTDLFSDVLFYSTGLRQPVVMGPVGALAAQGTRDELRRLDSDAVERS